MEPAGPFDYLEKESASIYVIHVAVGVGSTGKANEFVEKLVNNMSPDEVVF